MGCCTDDTYCYVNPENQLKCCAIGSDCDSLCPAQQYQCLVAATVNGTATSTASCCGRTCPGTSAFKCASAYGGGCCSYGSTCGPDNACIATATASSSALVGEVVSGCTTSQFSCAVSLGGGCCNDGLVCTVVGGTNYCANPTGGSSARTGGNSTIHSGLSTGAKAGIGAGVGIGGCAVILALLWCFMVRRRHARLLAKAASTNGGASEASEAKLTGSMSPGVRQMNDYFGPNAAAVGPYTEDPMSSHSTSPGLSRGVPLSPHDPTDIAAPVEIDSRGITSTSPVSPLSNHHPLSPGIMEQLKARTPSPPPPPPTELPS